MAPRADDPGMESMSSVKVIGKPPTVVLTAALEARVADLLGSLRPRRIPRSPRADHALLSLGRQQA